MKKINELEAVEDGAIIIEKTEKGGKLKAKWWTLFVLLFLAIIGACAIIYFLGISGFFKK